MDQRDIIIIRCQQVTRSCSQAILVSICLLLQPALVTAQTPPYANEPGWKWHLRPAEAGFSMLSRGGFVITFSELKTGDLQLTLAFSKGVSEGAFKLRAVGFDEAGRRFDFNASVGGSSNDVTLSTFVMPADRLAYGQMKLFGIETLTYDSLRAVVAPGASKKLRDQGEHALNYPELGKPYEYRLKAVNGLLLVSRDYAGKVVLIDLWASWCTPCMAKMPKLKELYQDLHPKGFEVIGINHDFTPERVEQTLAKEQLPWHEVVAPIGDSKRELWKTAAGISSLPRLWLIDRNGILRADVSIPEMEEEIRKLVAE